MKFSEVDEHSWLSVGAYFDTCLIPYTGLSGKEKPWEATAALERLRDFLDYIEIPFKGRVVTYPAVQYGGNHAEELLNEICHNVKSAGFKYPVVVSADVQLDTEALYESALVLSLPAMGPISDEALKSAVAQQISDLWNKQPVS